MDKQAAGELLDLIVERAQGLRAAGIRSVNLGGASFTLAPAELEPDGDAQDEETGPSDALHDPWTFGVPAPDAPKVLPPRRRSL